MTILDNEQIKVHHWIDNLYLDLQRRIKERMAMMQLAGARSSEAFH
jgi:hypothetical protein